MGKTMNTFDPEMSQRRSIRLQHCDYAMPGGYFITICTQDRKCLFGGAVANGASDGPVGASGARPQQDRVRNDPGIVLNEYGNIVREEWLRTSEIRREIVLDEYVVMPNHFHAIVMITDDREIRAGDRQLGTGDRPVAPTGPSSKSISALMAGYKAIVTKRINILRRTPGFPVWQRNYYEHVIRNDDELNQIRQYILDNPMNWASDKENPEYKYEG